MTEITRVPIKPVGAGSIAKVWIGVVLAVLLGGSLAWAALPKTLNVETLVEGDGPQLKVGDVAFVDYTGTLASNGEEFDKSRPIPWPIQGVMPQGSPFPVEEGATVPGFFQGLQKMRKGGKYELYIPSELAYGDEVPEGGAIPPGADLIFEVEVLEIMPGDEFRQKEQLQMAAFQQQQQQQLQQQGNSGPPPGAPLNAPPPPEPAPAP